MRHQTLSLLRRPFRDRLDKRARQSSAQPSQGYSGFVVIRVWSSSCPNSHDSLTLHMDTKTIDCHYCGFFKGFSCLLTVKAAVFIARDMRTQENTLDWQNSFLRLQLRMDVDRPAKKAVASCCEPVWPRVDILLELRWLLERLHQTTLVGVLNADDLESAQFAFFWEERWLPSGGRTGRSCGRRSWAGLDSVTQSQALCHSFCPRNRTYEVLRYEMSH